jgi:hypothetical protein
VDALISVAGDPLKPTPSEDYRAMCNALSIGNNGERLSNIPFNINIVAFTFSYLVYLTSKNKQVNSNNFAILFFTILLFSMIIWEVINGCSQLIGIFLAIVIGASLGAGFCEMLDYMATQYKIQGLHFFTNVTNDKDVCKMTNEDLFECTSDNPTNTTTGNTS